MKPLQIIEAQPNQYAWVVAIEGHGDDSYVECSRWPVLAWTLKETPEAVLVQPVLPDGLHLSKHAIALEAATGQVTWEGELFDSATAFSSALLAEHITFGHAFKD